MTRRKWTHRRLGIGTTRPTATALASTDQMLNDVAARVPVAVSGDAASDPVRLALLDYVQSIDAQIPGTNVPTEYRASLAAPATAAQRRHGGLLLPLLTATAAASVIAAVGLVHRADTTPATRTQPAVVAISESHALLHHAGALLSAAKVASSPDRLILFREARADLHHVGSLVPLAAPSAQPDLRQQLHHMWSQHPLWHHQHHQSSGRGPGPGHGRRPWQGRHGGGPGSRRGGGPSGRHGGGHGFGH